MAELHIQEKKSNSWLWIILGAIVLALVAWWLLAGDADDTVDDVGVAPAPAVTPADPGQATPVGGDVITDLSTLMGTGDAAAMMGRRVALTGVPVHEAVSDKGFWIGSGTGVGTGVFAVRTNQTQDNTAPDGAVSAGKMANVWGMITAMPTNLRDASTTWNLRSTDEQVLSQHRYYIHVDSVRIAN